MEVTVPNAEGVDFGRGETGANRRPNSQLGTPSPRFPDLLIPRCLVLTNVGLMSRVQTRRLEMFADPTDRRLGIPCRPLRSPDHIARQRIERA